MGNYNSSSNLSQQELDSLVTQTGLSKEDISTMYEDLGRKFPDGKVPKEVKRTFVKLLPVRYFWHLFQVYIYNCYLETDLDFLHGWNPSTKAQKGKIDMSFRISNLKARYLLQIFEFYDLNNDKKITREELTKVLQDAYDLFGIGSLKGQYFLSNFAISN